MIIRDGDAGDSENILSLRRLVFGEFEEDKLRPDFWKWEFLDGPAGKAFIYIAEDEKKLVGHFADIPRRFSVNGDVLMGTLSLDLMVHADYRRKGIFAEMAHYAAQRLNGEKCLFMTAFPIRKETIGGLLKIGWETVGELPVLVYPLRFRAIINRYLHFLPVSLLFGGIARGVYFLLWKGKRTKEHRGIQLEQVKELDPLFDRFWEKARMLYPVIGVRDRSFLKWRYFQNPVRTYRVYRSIEDRQMTGYLIVRSVDLLQFRSAVVVDLLALNDQALTALVEKGIEDGLQEEVDLLGCMVPRRHPYYRALRRQGFLPSLKAFRFMVYRLAKENVPLRPEAWYVNWGDTDVI